MLNLLEKIAKALIKKFNPVVICITGSVGKTSVKNAIASTLNTSFNVRKTPKNINNEFGVAISVIGGFRFREGFWALLQICFNGLRQLFLSRNFPDFLVIEVGAGKIGEIERISKWLKPNFLVITNLPNKPSHLGIFESKEKIIKEKKFLADVMNNLGIMLIDESEDNMKFFTKDFTGKIINYNSKEIIASSNYSILYRKNEDIIQPIGVEFDIDILGKKQRISFMNFIGIHNVKAILISKIIAETLNCNRDAILDGLRKYEPEPGRLRILQGKIEGVTIIDDSFNSSPIAVENSLYNLVNIEINENQRKIAVLGDMLNLGKESEAIHENTAIKFISNIDILVTVGDKSKIWQEFNDNKLNLNKHFRNSTDSAEYVKDVCKKGDIILFKGGHFIRLEKAIKILANCTEKDLVRQEKYWQKPEFELYHQKNG